MKPILLALVLSAGLTGCFYDDTYRGPEVNPLALLKLDTGMEEAICEYGLTTSSFRDRKDCKDFWREKYRKLMRDMEEKGYGSVYDLNEDKVEFGVRESGLDLVMYVGNNPNYITSASVSIMFGNRISYWNQHIKHNLLQIESNAQKITCEKKLIQCP